MAGISLSIDAQTGPLKQSIDQVNQALASIATSANTATEESKAAFEDLRQAAAEAAAAIDEQLKSGGGDGGGGIGDQLQEQAERGRNALNSLSEAAKLAGLAIGTGLGALAAFTIGQIEPLAQLQSLSEEAGISAEAMSGLAYAAEQVGINAKQSVEAVNELFAAANKNPELFKKIGVEAKAPLDTLIQLSAAMKGISDEETKAALGAAIFGKSWKDAANLLGKGDEELKNLIAEGRALSGVTNKAAEDAKELADQFDKLKTTASGLGVAIAGPLISGLNEFIQKVRDANAAGPTFLGTLKGIANGLSGTTRDTADEKNLLINQRVIEQLGKIKEIEETISLRRKSGLDTTSEIASLQKEQVELNRLVKVRSEFLDQQDELKRIGQAKIDSALGNKVETKVENTTNLKAVNDIINLDKDREAALKRQNKDLETQARILDVIFQKESARGKNPNTFKVHQERGGPVVGPYQMQEATFNAYRQPGERFDSKDFKVQERAAKKYIADLYQHFDGDIAKTLGGYFAGQPNMDRYIAKAEKAGGNYVDFLPPKTRQYVSDGLKKFKETKDPTGITAFEDQAKEIDRQVKEMQEQEVKYQEVITRLNTDTASLKLPENLVRMNKEILTVEKELGLSGENLTARQLEQKAAIEQSIQVKYQEIAASKRQQEQWDELVKDANLRDKILDDNKAFVEGIVSLEQYTKQLVKLRELYDDFKSSGGKFGIDLPTFTKESGDLTKSFNLSQQVEETKKAAKDMSEFAKEAARNVQDIFADFLFDPFKDGLKGMVDQFGEAMRRIAANYLAQQFTEYLFGKNLGGGGGAVSNIDLSKIGQGAESALSGIGNAIGSLIGFLGFATGTSYIDRDMFARVHKGEAVIPAEYNLKGLSPFGHIPASLENKIALAKDNPGEVDGGIRYVNEDKVIRLHKGDAVIPADYNQRGVSPYEHNAVAAKQALAEVGYQPPKATYPTSDQPVFESVSVANSRLNKVVQLSDYTKSDNLKETLSNEKTAEIIKFSDFSHLKERNFPVVNAENVLSHLPAHVRQAVIHQADIPQYATGTDNVPKDMLAYLHKGEAVIPTRYNPARWGGDWMGKKNQQSAQELAVTQYINVGSGADTGRVRMAAGQGLREAYEFANSSSRYR